uniref:Uncharacterized protein n=1 Tax=Oryza glumipatula TaxID=40148 RepID=A0A0D9ZTZ7_9ORYZ
MRLYCFYAAALFILCFLLPAAVAEEMRSQMDGDSSEETVSDHGPPPLDYYYYDDASATMMTFDALHGRRYHLRHRLFFPSHTATAASKPRALAATAFDLRDAIVDGEADLFRVEQRRRRRRPGTGKCK